MRANAVEVFQPMFCDQTHLLQAVEDIGIQDIFPKRAVEAFDVGVLPAAAALDEQRLYTQVAQPFPQPDLPP